MRCHTPRNWMARVGRLLAGVLDYPPRKVKRSFSAEALRLRLIGYLFHRDACFFFAVGNA